MKPTLTSSAPKNFVSVVTLNTSPAYLTFPGSVWNIRNVSSTTALPPLNACLNAPVGGLLGLLAKVTPPPFSSLIPDMAGGALNISSYSGLGAVNVSLPDSLRASATRKTPSVAPCVTTTPDGSTPYMDENSSLTCSSLAVPAAR